MNKKQRVLNAIKGLEVDRVPASWYTHFEPDDDNTVSSQVRWAKNTDMDLLCVETDGFMEFDCGNAPMNTPRALMALREHKAHDYYIEGQIDRAKRIADGLRDGAAVTYMIFTPFSTIKHSIHSETGVMDLLREDPEAVRHAMEVIQSDNFLVMERLKAESGIDGIFLSMQNAEIDRFAPGEYRTLLAPWDKQLIDKARELFDFTILHLCAWRGLPNQMELWQGYEADVVNWAAHIELDLGLAAGRSLFKEGTALMGGFDNRPCGILHWGSEKQIKAYTKRLISQAGDGGLILSADCSVQKDTPDEHLRWVVEACEEYAREGGV